MQHRVQDTDGKRRERGEGRHERGSVLARGSVFIRLRGAKVKVSASWLESKSVGRSQQNAALILENV